MLKSARLSYSCKMLVNAPHSLAVFPIRRLEGDTVLHPLVPEAVFRPACFSYEVCAFCLVTGRLSAHPPILSFLCFSSTPVDNI